MSSKLPGVRQWIWRAFVRSALIPLVLVEAGLIAAYLLSNNAIRDAQVEHLRESAVTDLHAAVALEARIVNEQLANIARQTELFALQTDQALTQDGVPPAPVLALSVDGVRYSPADRGGAASFYSGVTAPANQDLAKVARLTRLDPLMKHIKTTQPLVASLYFNSFDSYNHIYPWFLTPQQYPHDMRIPAYNFYYLADAEHNPDRGVVWTDVYLDPAGHGWMLSAIAPVYRRNFLEGVVGIDITVSGILQQIDQLQVPWDGYAMLVSGDLSIMALPKKGEADFGLSELTEHSYNEAIRRETFKPADFTLSRRDDTRELAAAIGAAPRGLQAVELDGRRHLVAWHTVAQTGWHLLAVVDEADVFRQTHVLANRYQVIGFLLILGLAVFYGLYFLLLWWRARRLSQQLLTPIAGVSRMMSEIGRGHWRPARPGAALRELEDMAEHASVMGLQLEQSERHRRSVQRHLELVLECATESLWEWSPQSGRMSLRGRLVSRFGLPAELALEDFLSRLHPDDRNGMRQALAAASDDGRHDLQVRFIDGRGREHWLLSRGRVVERDPDSDAPSLLAGTHIDIDRLKRVEADLREASDKAQAASRAKSRFISSMSHELRTPLNAIQGFAQLMQLEGRDADGPDYGREILLASQHLSQLVSDILDWSSIQAERPRVEPRAVDAGQMMAECAELVRLDAERQGLQLEVLLPPAPLRVRADPRRLRQVLLNLLSNAIKYNRPRGRVGLSCERHGARLRLMVEDTGFGISPALHDKVFEPFQRLGQENTSIQGSGIGLSLCREYALLMGGEMGLSSRPGAGSCFWIELALLDEAPPMPPTRQAGDAPLPRIGYVEDNPTSQLLIRKALADLGQVELASNGREALATLLADPPALLLLDLNLPGMNGDALLRELRAAPKTRALPVIVLSAANDDELDALTRLGCRAVVPKPVDLQALRAEVAAVLRGEAPVGC